MKRFFTLLLIISFFSCTNEQDDFIEPDCDCVAREYVVNSLGTTLINTYNINADCEDDNLTFNELYDNNGVLVGYTKIFCFSN